VTTPGLRGEVVRLGKGSFTYFLAMVVTRGLNLVLAPLYARFMAPAEYGIVGFASSLVPALAVVFGLSAHSAASRLYYTTPDDGSRQRLVGTVLAYLLVVPLALGLVVEVLGDVGALGFFRSVPYSPYLRLVVWASVLLLFTTTLLNMLVIREQHALAALLNAASVFLTAGFTIAFVIALRMGAYGQLLGLVLTNATLAAISLVLLWRISRPVVDRAQLRVIVTTSLPLVPHELMRWGMAGSDRIVLERYVSAAALGNYTLGYTFGTSAGMVSTAIINAFIPMVNRKLGEGDPRNEVPPLGTIVATASALVTLGAAVALPPLIRLFFPVSYQEAAGVIPWIAVGLFFQTLFSIWSTGTIFSQKTAGIAGVTLVGAIVNIGLNLVLVPRYGILAAAITTALGYAMMAVLHAMLAHRLLPIPWEYGRTVRLGLAGVLAYFAATVTRGLGPVPELFLGGLVALVAFAAALVVLRVVRAADIARVRAVIAARRGRSKG